MRHTFLINCGFSHNYFQRNFAYNILGTITAKYGGRVTLSQLSTKVCCGDCASRTHLSKPTLCWFPGSNVEMQMMCVWNSQAAWVRHLWTPQTIHVSASGLLSRTAPLPCVWPEHHHGSESVMYSYRSF